MNLFPQFLYSTAEKDGQFFIFDEFIQKRVFVSETNLAGVRDYLIFYDFNDEAASLINSCPPGAIQGTFLPKTLISSKKPSSSSS